MAKRTKRKGPSLGYIAWRKRAKEYMESQLGRPVTEDEFRQFCYEIRRAQGKRAVEPESVDHWTFAGFSSQGLNSDKETRKNPWKETAHGFVNAAGAYAALTGVGAVPASIGVTTAHMQIELLPDAKRVQQSLDAYKKGGVKSYLKEFGDQTKKGIKRGIDYIPMKEYISEAIAQNKEKKNPSKNKK